MIKRDREGVYSAYINENKELVFVAENKVDYENKERYPQMIFSPEDADQLIEGILSYSAKGLGRTSFMKSLGLTKINKSKLIMSNILVAFFFMSLMTIFNFFVMYEVTTYTNFIATDFTAFGEYIYLEIMNGGHIFWNEIRWFSLSIALFFAIATSMTMAFFIISITKRKSTLYLFSFFYLIAFWILIWTVLPSFLAYGKILSDGEKYNFIVWIRYFIPHYWSVVMIKWSVPTSSSTLSNIVSTIVNQNIDWGYIFGLGFVALQRTISDFILGFFDDASLETIALVNGVSSLLANIILSNKDFIIISVEKATSWYNIIPKQRTGLLDVNSAYDFFTLVGTMIFAILFLLLSMKFFTWTSR